jgi:hypothetical protein
LVGIAWVSDRRGLLLDISVFDIPGPGKVPDDPKNLIGNSESRKFLVGSNVACDSASSKSAGSSSASKSTNPEAASAPGSAS